MRDCKRNHSTRMETRRLPLLICLVCLITMGPETDQTERLRQRASQVNAARRKTSICREES